MSSRTPSKRVLLLTSNFPRWEGDNTTPFILHLASDLQDLGWLVHVVAPHAPGADREATLDGVRVSRFRYWWPVSGETVCYDGGALTRLKSSRTDYLKVPPLVTAELGAVLLRLRKQRYDVLNSHWLLPQGFVGAVARSLTHVPHVATVHGGDVFALRSSPLLAFKKRTIRGSDAITVNSSATLRAVQELGATASVNLIPMGAEVPSIDPIAVADIRRRHRVGNGPLLCFVGRLVPEKGADDLVSALAEIRRTMPDATLVIVGEGPFRPPLEEQVRRLGLVDSVYFAGWRSTQDVFGFLAASDVFVGPSKPASNGWVEALGLSFVEAAMIGKPVVATELGGITDIIQHERTGLLVPSADPPAIARAVERLYQNPSLARRLGENAKVHAMSRFTRRASAEAFSEVLSSVSKSER